MFDSRAIREPPRTYHDPITEIELEDFDFEGYLEQRRKDAIAGNAVSELENSKA